jgi:hypothetical protein
MSAADTTMKMPYLCGAPVGVVDVTRLIGVATEPTSVV